MTKEDFDTIFRDVRGETEIPTGVFSTHISEMYRLANAVEKHVQAAALKQLSSPWDESVEELAKAIYNDWVALPGFVPWVERGNSIKQDQARDLARKLLKVEMNHKVNHIVAQRRSKTTD